MRFLLFSAASVWLLFQACEFVQADEFEQRVRALLSNRCFACHGPDEEERQGGFRLDVPDSFLSEADTGMHPVVAGDPEASEMLRRITTTEEWERMPPPSSGAPLSEAETQLIEQWIERGANLTQHWSFVPPTRPALPKVEVEAGWDEHPVDRFVLRKQIEHGLSPSPSATKAELLRRLSLDLTGLPPTPQQVAHFESNDAPNAYLQEVDRLLASTAYGEHWARKWLDLARYADSAGYADDPPRTIWAYRDWVIRALNANMPIDEFTVRQIAGDLLPSPAEDDFIATAFHRNTLTNNEGGTNNEEFRNVAIVDRVNTTMAVWMGVTMACAQCHTHKYDPFTQEEYFRLFAIFNQSQDADLRDESPTLELFTPEQRQQRRQLQAESEELAKALAEPTQALEAEFAEWSERIQKPMWHVLQPESFRSQAGLTASIDDQGVVHVAPSPKAAIPASDVFRVAFDIDSTNESLAGLQLKTKPRSELPQGGAGFGGGNFVLSGVKAWVTSRESSPAIGQRVRIELPGKSKILSLAEVQVFSQGSNIATQGEAKQSSTAYNGPAKLAIDGNTAGAFREDESTTHTEQSNSPWWELKLNQAQPIDKIVIWNRTDNNLHSRLDGARIQILDKQGSIVFSDVLEQAFATSAELSVRKLTPIKLTVAGADYSQTNFTAEATLDADDQTGWAVGGKTQETHFLNLIPETTISIDQPSQLVMELQFQSPHKQHLLGGFELRGTTDQTVHDWTRLSPNLQDVCLKAPEVRTAEESSALHVFFRCHLAATTRPIWERLETIEKRLAELKPATSVPVMRELSSEERRETFVQIRGNYKSVGQKVEPGTPQVFHSLATDTAAQEEPQTPSRLDLARWLVDRRNPLTARVWVNRIWESLFGLGIVRSSEEFGAQGERPSHPDLLDWLAVEFMQSGWDQKSLLRLLVTSQTYQQSSRVQPGMLDRDQDNIWLARGPRVRLSAEMVRDQALAASGLLAREMYGAPVRPPQPDMGLKAAFGSKTDWQASQGGDRYRRGLYTTWRRSNPYPSMATFDAPSREVCTLRRDSTNTPLQALVTLNDPAFVEAAQALARRVVIHSELRDQDARLARAFELATSREPTDAELSAMRKLLVESKATLSGDSAAAVELATKPLGPLPKDADAVNLAAFTTVCNVLLNLDEVLMKR